jgi:FMN phosphatase YigB (HAD superfamily)
MSVVFLLDVDNTLLDNDQLKADLAAQIEHTIGPERAARFWELYEEVRHEKDYVDFPGTLRRFAQEYGDAQAQSVTAIVDTVPFSHYLYPHVLGTVAYLNSLGEAVILSDGDPVFQPFKIKQSGLEAAVQGRVLIYVHKEDELPNVFAAYPADHYVAVDDKPRIVSALEASCPATFTTILVLQGKYARPDEARPRPDFIIKHIADLRGFSLQQFLEPGRVRSTAT